MKDKNNVNLKAYLFANLVILCVLLIGIWNRKPVWDVNIRFPNLLLILVIINTVLIFKEFIINSPASGTKSKSRSKKKSRSFSSLRRIISSGETPDEKAIETIIEKLLPISGQKCLALILEEKSGFRMAASSGDLPAVIPGIKFSLKENSLHARYPGNLGEEIIGEIKEDGEAISFSSAITRLDGVFVPLFLSNAKAGFLIIPGVKSPSEVGFSLSSTALHLETMLSLIESTNASGDARYKDKTTGLLRYECFADSFETEVERSERYQQVMTLLSLEILNIQNYSPEEVKSLQKALAQSMKQSLRRLDIMFCGSRNSEFLAILTETNTEVSEVVAGRIAKTMSKQVAKFDFVKDKEQLISIGGATYPSDATHGDGLLEKSQEALKSAISSNATYVSYVKMNEIS